MCGVCIRYCGHDDTSSCHRAVPSGTAPAAPACTAPASRRVHHVARAARNHAALDRPLRGGMGARRRGRSLRATRWRRRCGRICPLCRPPGCRPAGCGARPAAGRPYRSAPPAGPGDHTSSPHAQAAVDDHCSGRRVRRHCERRDDGAWPGDGWRDGFGCWAGCRQRFRPWKGRQWWVHSPQHSCVDLPAGLRSWALSGAVLDLCGRTRHAGWYRPGAAGRRVSPANARQDETV
jgi:hypothetical protein